MPTVAVLFVGPPFTTYGQHSFLAPPHSVADDTLDKRVIDRCVDAPFYESLQGHFIRFKSMAELVLAEDHFYVNASTYNSGKKSTWQIQLTFCNETATGWFT